jgi:uncharacterized protein YjiK
MGPSIRISRPWDIRKEGLQMDDFSGLHFDRLTRNLLVVSDEAKLLAEVTCQGKRLGFMDLEKGFCGLTRDIPQPEGVAMDEERRIYVVSEPDLLYIYHIQGDQPRSPSVAGSQE